MSKIQTLKKTSPFRVIGIILAVIAAITATLAAVVNYTFRIGYVFIDKEVFAGFSDILFAVMVINAIYAIGVAAAAIAKKKVPVLVIIGSVFNFILALLFWVVNYVASGIAHIETTYIILTNLIPFLLALFGVPFLLLCFPNLKISKKARNVVAVILTTIFLGSVVAVTIVKVPPFKFDFDSLPVVFDIGENAAGVNEYSVVFSTNADAQAYVTYTYQSEEKTVFANAAGYKAIGKIHAVKIPRAELDGNTYTVHAIRVIERLAYGGKLGNTISSEAYTLKDTTNVANPKFISASDWHSEMDILQQASDYAQDGSIDLVFLTGDFADFYVSDEQIIEYFLKGGHYLTKGEIPAIFVRGNHEVRANIQIDNLGNKIGLSKMYYQTKRGDTVITVFDTAESESGDEWEHIGFYDMVSYFEEQVAWFATLPIPDLSKINIVAMHDPEFTIGWNDAHTNALNAFRNIANSFNIDFTLSGHSHNWDLSGPNANTNYYRFQDGGRNGGNVSKTILDIPLLKDVEISSTIRSILSLIALENTDSYYILSIITCTSTEIIFESCNNSGGKNNYSSINR